MARNQARNVALIVVFSAACGQTPVEKPQLLQRIPAEWSGEELAGDVQAPLTAWWVVSTRDCLDCQSLDQMLRRLHYEHSESVTLRVVHIGDPEDEGMVQRFLATHRLPLSVTRIARNEHLSSAAGRWPIPLLLLTRRDSMVWILTPGSEPVPMMSIVAAIDSLRES